MGFVYPLQGVWTRFSGLRWHAVLPARGERYSISLFSPSHMDKLREEHWRLLAELGWRAPLCFEIRRTARIYPPGLQVEWQQHQSKAEDVAAFACACKSAQSRHSRGWAKRGLLCDPDTSFALSGRIELLSFLG
eukprot:5835948-Amphidinium_carterae.1